MATVKIKGGDKLKEALKQISKEIRKKGKVQVGFMDNSVNEDGVSIPMIAAIQNFGAPSRGIPPRPFFSNMVKDKSPEWPNQLRAILKNSNYDAPLTLGRMGALIASQLEDSIIATNDPPLSPITVMLRGMRSRGKKITGKTVGEAAQRVEDGKTNYGASTKPLVDRGDMLRAVTYKVSE